MSTVTVHGLEGAKVDSLLRMNSKEWDFDLKRNIFNENDARRILKIPIFYSDQDDKWMWLEDSKGDYTVKSGYRMLSRGFSQNPGGVSGFKWLRLWNLAAPPKIKNFMWRVMHYCLPTLENLRRKCVDVLSTCQMCRLSTESLDHSLLACPFANQCWDLCNLDKSRPLGQSISQVVINAFESLPQSELQIFRALMWSIWNHRNSVVWNSKYKNSVLVINEASSTFFHWQQA